MRFTIPANAQTWVEIDSDTEFPIQNLPFAPFFHAESEQPGAGFRIGNYAFDVMTWTELSPERDAIDLNCFSIFQEEFAAKVSEARKRVYQILSEEANDTVRARARECLVPAESLELWAGVEPRTFVDFYSGIHHASNVGRMFRPDQPPLLPNYRHLPIGYHGRASSVLPSGFDVIRPWGQIKPGDGDPIFTPTRELDFELEMGAWIGIDTDLGEQLSVADAQDAIAGFVLVNDWSARDVQRWEYQPLGPFLAKSFMTSFSEWMVLPDALIGAEVSGIPQEPAPLPYLAHPEPRSYDIQLEVTLQSARMQNPQVIARSNSKHLYWSFAQQIAHMTSNGTPLCCGDLYASGTISGEEPGTFGSMLELTWRGTQPITLEETGETRTFLEDGDTLTLRGWAVVNGIKIGFGEVSATVLSANPAVAR